MTEEVTINKQIIDTLNSKSVVKQDIYEQTLAAFTLLRSCVKKKVEEIKPHLVGDNRIVLEYKNKGEFEFHLCVAGDVLIFNMHTNVFKFDDAHSLWKTTYLKTNELNGYNGMINIYNFLADSFKYNRVFDRGYMIGRLFVNRENHFMMEGKRKFGFLYNDFANSKLSKEIAQSIVDNLIVYTLGFDLFTPPFDQVKEVSVQEIKTIGDTMQLKTGKRLGFQFSADEN